MNRREIHRPLNRVVRGQRVKAEKIKFCKRLRKEMTEEERTMWQMLRANRFGGWHFRRQQILRGFIVDFYCHAAKLVVEIDGETHFYQVDYDRRREAALRSMGLKVVRFKAIEVREELDLVLRKLERFLPSRAQGQRQKQNRRQRHLSPQPPSLGGKG